MSAGYSKRALRDKLGLKQGRAHFRHAPDGYRDSLEPLPDQVRTSRVLRGRFDFIHAFYDRLRRLERELPALAAALHFEGALWLSWPKKASGVATDVTESDVRRLGLATGLVDVKICAVDSVWSGLKFVYRKKDRPS